MEYCSETLCNAYVYLNLKEKVVCHQKSIGQEISINMEKTPRKTSKKQYIFVMYGMKVIKLDHINLCLVFV